MWTVHINQSRMVSCETVIEETSVAISSLEPSLSLSSGTGNGVVNVRYVTLTIVYLEFQ